MVSSSDIIEDHAADSARNRFYKTIELDDNIGKFRSKFYSGFLSWAYRRDISITEKQGLVDTFNGVTVTLLRPSESFMFNGPMEMVVLEHGEDVIILTGEIIKRSLSSPTKFFKLSDGDPVGAIATIFSRLADAYSELESNFPNEYERREFIISQMTPIDDVDQTFEQKVKPLIFNPDS